MSARDEVLGRVRAALGTDPAAPPVPRGYRTAGGHPRGSAPLVDLLEQRLLDYKAVVVRPGPAGGSAAGRVVGDAGVARGVSEALAGLCLPEGATVLHAPGLPAAWVPPGAATPDDGVRGAHDLDRVHAVVTGSVVAVAETGTIVLDASPACGRRALTLVPDRHVCVVRVGDVVQTMPEALAAVDPLRPLTFVSGPSATSDIELNRVEGVHGPRRLVVVLV